MTTRDMLLRHLKKSGEAWISGEQISAELNVSRAAISKQIKKLRDQGYSIESASKKGYRLELDPDLLLPAEIRENLKNRVFGNKDIHYFEEIDSTNTKAKELAEQGAPEGTLVIAESQTLGRGRRGRQWYSSHGKGIYATIILRPNIPPMGAPRITLMTAVAVAKALLSQANMDIRIKWPNDILVKNKKLVGILTEISTEMDAVNYILVGFGVNVNTPTQDFPPEISGIATSIFVETGKVQSRLKLLQACLEQFETYYNMFKQNEFGTILQQWKILSKTMGSRIVVDVLGQKYTGKILDIDDDGVLILKDDENKIHRIFSGDITLQ